MKKERKVLVPHGLPWRSIAAGVLTTVISAAIILNVVDMHSSGGAWLVSTLVGLGVFSATLG